MQPCILLCVCVCVCVCVCIRERLASQTGSPTPETLQCLSLLWIWRQVQIKHLKRAFIMGWRGEMNNRFIPLKANRFHLHPPAGRMETTQKFREVLFSGYSMQGVHRCVRCTHDNNNNCTHSENESLISLYILLPYRELNCPTVWMSLCKMNSDSDLIHILVSVWGDCQSSGLERRQKSVIWFAIFNLH